MRHRSGMLALALVLGLLAAGPASAEDPKKKPENPDEISSLVETLGKGQLRDPSPETPPGHLRRGLEFEAPTHGGAGKGQKLEGRYIIVFRPGTRGARDLSEQLVRQNDGRLLFAYEHALKGFAAELSPQKIEGLRRNPNVLSIEPDSVVVAEATQTGATWGLDRIDQRDLPLNSAYTYNSSGAGVHAYVIDTGIRLDHHEFSGRIGNGFDAVTSGGNANDCNGHGTHVAGTVGGTTYGVAKKVTLHPVRVLTCTGSGTTAGVIAGVDWVTRNHVKPAVANMSLGGGASSTLDSAVSNSIASGVTYALAAGNDNANACNYSPARVPNGLTVGATTTSDARSSFSNFGSCVDIFAPGSSITAAWHTSSSATNTISGTSMAAPHVAGVAALVLETSPSATPAAVRDTLVSSATPQRITNVGTGSPNMLLYSLGGGTTPPPPPPPANTLRNVGFESGPGVAWTEYSVAGYQLVTNDRPRTGSFSSWLGGYNYATEYIYQQVTVPTSGSLSYWWRMESSEPPTTIVYDYLDVRLYDAATGSYLTTLRRWSNASTRNAWTQDTLSVGAYAGRQVLLVFYTVTDSSYTTSFFIDDTSLT